MMRLAPQWNNGSRHVPTPFRTVDMCKTAFVYNVGDHFVCFYVPGHHHIGNLYPVHFYSGRIRSLYEEIIANV